MGTGVAQFEAAVDCVAGLDVDELSSRELHDLIRELSKVSTRLEAQLVRVVHRWDASLAWADNGSKAPGARLARETGMPVGDAKRLVRRGRALRSMPLTETGYLAGNLNGAHVDLIGSCDRDWVNTNLADAEQTLVNFCSTNVFGEAAEQVRMWQMFADRDIDHPDPGKASREADRNRLSAVESFQGRTFLDANLDPIAGAIVRGELERLAELIRLQDLRDGAERTPTQRRAAALVEMATRSATMPADGRRPKPLITITMGAEHFAWMCHTASGTIIEPELVMPYLTDVEIERMIFDPANRKLEASTRTPFTGALRTIIGLRDRHCQHASGCDQPAHLCDVDHINPRSCGGLTCVCNGQLLCKYHNRIGKAEHDRQLALQHKSHREAEQRQTGCLIAHPEPARYIIDTPNDLGLSPHRLAKLFDHGITNIDYYRIRPAA